jgi:hypothetical protein
LARWIVTPIVRVSPDERIKPERPQMVEKEKFSEAAEALCTEPAESNTDLHSVLAAIADDVQEIAAAARGGIMAEFAGRIADARKRLPRHAAAGAVAMLKEARKAALALVKRNAALELAGRKKAAIQARRRPSAARYGRKPGHHAPPRH